MTPLEAAGLLGVRAGAASGEVLQAHRLADAHTDPGDALRRAALAQARDLLLASAPWQAPFGAGGGGSAYAAPGAPSTPGNPYAPPATLAPAAYAPSPYAPSPHAPSPYAPAPYAPPRRGPSTGAILGWALGGTGALLVLILVAVFGVAASLPRSVGAVGGGSGGSYEVDGVTVAYTADSWDFTLTSSRDCSAAQVTVGFSDSVDGEVLDQRTDSVELEAGVPYSYTVSETASDHPYASVDAIDCTSW